ncbi:MAG TPA: TetR/AcrR family transcriptional regulator [Candidatus Sulfotelmatobacter sp.]|nr:TetR/AcrR family transcriptional regulator [Candidatus Sulfotelmatobacter sp.]HXP84106.1 TetR/AcrR family transcriptional regulator [Bryobacteraceae bacterium]
MTQTTKTQTAKTKPKAAKPRPKIDRRILRTRDALGDAMMALLHEKSFDEITVQQVLDRAGVGRATFYAHYRDKDDLFLSDVEDFLEHVSGVLKRQNANPRRLLPVREFLTHIRDVREFHAALVKSDKLNEVWTLARGFFARSIEERLQAAGVQLDPASRSAQAHALAGSFFSLLDWWIDKGMKADPKEMDDLFHHMAWSGLQGR